MTTTKAKRRLGIVFGILLLCCGAVGTSSFAAAAPSTSLASVQRAADSDSFLVAPATPEQRFDLDNFIARETTETADVNAARTADYEFLRTLATTDKRSAVGRAPNRNYKEIQARLAAEQSQQDQTAGINDLSAYLFGMTSNETSATTSVNGNVHYLTAVEEAELSGWRTAKASWYGPGFYGNHTADGTVYDDSILLVAHKTLPLGTKVAISYGGRTVIVPVKDRGPYVSGREFDLSAGLARALNFSGVQTIRWALVD